MSNRKSATRIAAAAAALPIAMSVMFIAPAAHAAPGARPTASYTLAQVKKHNKASDCWTVVSKSVYKITAWIPKHPGGSGSVVAMCGKDGSALFASKHGKDNVAKGVLGKYKIGTLK